MVERITISVKRVVEDLVSTHAIAGSHDSGRAPESHLSTPSTFAFDMQVMEKLGEKNPTNLRLSSVIAWLAVDADEQ